MEPHSSEKNKKKFFNILPLEGTFKRASEVAKKPKATYNKEHIDRKVAGLKTNKANSIDYSAGLQIQASENSIDGYLAECHPDVRKFIEANEWTKIVAAPHTLVVTLRNKFRVAIENISRYSKSINIKDNRGNVIFKGVQTISYK